MLDYGACVACGCGIGAFFVGVASGSLHGWLWLPCAFVGSILGNLPAARLRPERGAHRVAEMLKGGVARRYVEPRNDYV